MTKVERHKQLCLELNQIYEKKNHDYGDSFHETWIEEGYSMARIRLSDKLNRFKTLSRSSCDAKVSDESLRDTLMDLANYAIMTVLEMEDVDYSGEETTYYADNEKLRYIDNDISQLGTPSYAKNGDPKMIFFVKDIDQNKILQVFERTVTDAKDSSIVNVGDNCSGTVYTIKTSENKFWRVSVSPLGNMKYEFIFTGPINYSSPLVTEPIYLHRNEINSDKIIECFHKAFPDACAVANILVDNDDASCVNYKLELVDGDVYNCKLSYSNHDCFKVDFEKRYWQDEYGNKIEW